MSSLPAEFDEPTYAYPPRFWWFKRIAIALPVLVAAYMGVLHWWAIEAERRMASEIAQLRAAGERVTIDDFQPPPISADQNAGLSLNNAASSISLSAQQQSLVHSLNRFAEIDPATLLKLQQIAKATQGARSLARTARFQPDVDWGYVIRSPVINALLPSLSPQRELALVLSVNVLCEHASGHDAEAVELMRDMVNQSDRMHEGSPMLVAHLIGIGMSFMTTSTIRAVVHDLDVQGDGQATTQPNGPASRRQVEALIAELIDERRYRLGFANAMQGERLMQHDTAVTVKGALPFGLPQIGPLRPMYVLDAVRMIRETTQIQTAGRSTDFPAARKAMPRAPKPWSLPQSGATYFSRIFSQILTPSLDRALHLHFKCLAERRIAALRLAMRLYQMDHQNDYPRRLEELVPAYLPALPADPFRSDGKTFGYLHSPTTQPVLYSVGPDGVDGGGDTSLPTRLQSQPNQGIPGEPEDRYADDRADWIFPLGKPTPPATLPTDEDSE